MANFNGSDTLTVLTSDAGNTGTGGPLTDSDTVAITVTAANDAPVNTVPGAQSVAEDSNLSRHRYCRSATLMPAAPRSRRRCRC